MLGRASLSHPRSQHSLIPAALGCQLANAETSSMKRYRSVVELKGPDANLAGIQNQGH
jgi:hypothetical protein